MPQDLDPLETREWLGALDSVLAFDGPERATIEYRIRSLIRWNAVATVLRSDKESS